MEWDEVMIPMLRHMIGDTSSDSPTYEDSDLKLKLLTSAMLIKIDITFDVDYAINIIGGTLTPDPSTSSPVDYAFMSLVCLKTACLIERGEARSLTRDEVKKIQDNDFLIETGNVGQNKLAALKINWCAAYDKAKTDYLAGILVNTVSKAVISPFDYAGGDYGYGRREWC